MMLIALLNPANYQSMIDSYLMPADVTGTNAIVFHAGQAAAKAPFFQDLFNQIRNVTTEALQAISAINIFNELSISVRQQSLSRAR